MQFDLKGQTKLTCMSEGGVWGDTGAYAHA